jgi:hypothetical protein
MGAITWEKARWKARLLSETVRAALTLLGGG